jgi:hypothetical protein
MKSSLFNGIYLETLNIKVKAYATMQETRNAYRFFILVKEVPW